MKSSVGHRLLLLAVGASLVFTGCVAEADMDAGDGSIDVKGAVAESIGDAEDGLGAAEQGLGASGEETAPAAPGVDFLFVVECDPPYSNGSEYTYDDTNPALKYTGTWKAETPGRRLFLGTQHITNVGGSTVSFTLPRSPYQFAYGFTKMRNAGKAAVYFNNQYVTTIDMYAPSTTENCGLWMYGGVPSGTLMVKALNQKNPASTGTYINVDYVYFEP